MEAGLPRFVAVLEYPVVVDIDEDPRLVRAVSEPFPLALVEVLLVTVARVVDGGELPPSRVVELAVIHTFIVVVYVLLTTVTLSMTVVDVSIKENVTVSAGRGLSTIVEVIVIVEGGRVSKKVETSVTVSF